MDEYPSNSRKQNMNTEQSEPKKSEKIIEGVVVRRKKPLGRRFAETFGGGDAKGAWSFVLMTVIAPTAKNLISDAITTAVERFIHGESNSSNRRSSSSRYHSSNSNDYTSYNRPVQRSSNRYDRDRDESRNMSRRARATHDFQEIILPSRHEANDVIDSLFRRIEEYGRASVADLYDMVGVTSEFTDNRWGWMDGSFRGAHVSRVRDGYLLDIPKPEPID